MSAARSGSLFSSRKSARTSRGVVMRDLGGDALDAVIAAGGALRGVTAADHAAIARHERYPHEGYMFA
jgi:hypothetical protein